MLSLIKSVPGNVSLKVAPKAFLRTPVVAVPRLVTK